MAYIDRNDVYFHCSYRGDCIGLSSDCEKCSDNVIDYQEFMEVPTADVVERSEYETLRLVNLDLAETNKGLLSEHEQLLKLRSKIDKAIEEIEKESYSESIYGDFYEEKTKIISVENVLEILKKNIGE